MASAPAPSSCRATKRWTNGAVTISRVSAGQTRATRRAAASTGRRSRAVCRVARTCRSGPGVVLLAVENARADAHPLGEAMTDRPARGHSRHPRGPTTASRPSASYVSPVPSRRPRRRLNPPSAEHHARADRPYDPVQPVGPGVSAGPGGGPARHRRSRGDEVLIREMNAAVSMAWPEPGDRLNCGGRGAGLARTGPGGPVGGYRFQEVASWQGIGQGAREVGPRDAGPLGCRVDSGLLQDLPDGRRGDLHAQDGKFTTCPPVAPSGILPRQTQDQGPGGARGARPLHTLRRDEDRRRSIADQGGGRVGCRAVRRFRRPAAWSDSLLHSATVSFQAVPRVGLVRAPYAISNVSFVGHAVHTTEPTA